MATYTSLELGSLVYNLIENIPTGISGLLVNGFLPEQAIFQAENYTGNDISTTAIPETYQPAIINLTISQVLGQMESQGLGTKSIKIGELAIGKGLTEGSSKEFRSMGIKLLEDLGHKSSFYQTWN